MVIEEEWPLRTEVHLVRGQLAQVAICSNELKPEPKAIIEPRTINDALPKELILRIFSYTDMGTLCRCALVCRLWRHLALDGSNWRSVDLFPYQKLIKGQIVERLAQRCGGFLRRLSLYGCENVQDAALQVFSRHCRHIEYLNLSKCGRLTDVSLRIDDEGLKAVGEYCKSLRKFVANGCSAISDVGINHIGSNCSQLQVISLHSCHHLTNASVISIAKGCRFLESFCAAIMPQITDQAVATLAQNCQSLKDVELTACHQLTDLSLISIGKNCKLIERIDCEDLVTITDVGVKNLAANCPNLLQVTLSHCEMITDEAVHHLANSQLSQQTSTLAILELDNCPSVTDRSLEILAQVQSLKKLDLFDCPMVSRAAIQTFKEKLPNVLVHAYFAPAPPLVQNEENVNAVENNDQNDGNVRRQRSRCPSFCVIS